MMAPGTCCGRAGRSLNGLMRIETPRQAGTETRA